MSAEVLTELSTFMCEIICGGIEVTLAGFSFKGTMNENYVYVLRKLDRP